MESQQNKERKKEVSFNFAKNDIEDIYLLSNLSKTLRDDLDKWAKERGLFRQALMNEIKLWVQEKQEEDILTATAKVSVEVIDHLLAKSVPFVVIEVYLSFLFYHKQKIEKHLNHEKADQIYGCVPTVLVLPFLKLYRIKLTHKEQHPKLVRKHTIIKEFVQNKDTCRQFLLAQLPKLFKNQYDYYADVVIRELQTDRKVNIAGRVMKKLRIPKTKYPDIYQALFQSAAIGLMKKDNEFTWQKLQEVFENYPKALATCIKVFVNDKKTQRLLIQGFASICRRNQRLYSLMPKKVVQTLKKVGFELPNQLRNNRFLPSDPKKYFSLMDFQIKEKHVIWVDDKNLNECLVNLSNQRLIGIDTESRVARSCLDTNKQLIATIQIATTKEVYVFDAAVLKKNQLRVPQIHEFFNNKEVTIVGHTLSADLNGDVTELLGYKGKVQCKAVDICPIFKLLYPNERLSSLAHISFKVLGKQICKEYTLTNWERRPLLKNQLHYAALDAVIVIKIWEKMRQHKDYGWAEKEVEAKQKKRRQERKDKKPQENGEQNENEGQQQHDQLEKLQEVLQK